jgi:ABC-type Fe3+/spermidine/putrescine transport system ATPase subunit
VLKIEGVSKRFRAGNFGVPDLSLDLQSDVIGLLGPNGAGKTTLMQMIATVTRPTTGRILFQGTDVVKRPNELRRQLGYLPQDFGVYDNLTAREFLTYFAALAGFLTFTYVVVNDHGATPWLDFAGSYGSATRATAALYLVLGFVALGLAQLSYARRLKA